MRVRAVVSLLSCAWALPAQVEHHDPAAAQLVARDAEVQKLGGGMEFTEGPVWMPEQQALVFSDIPRSELLRWTAAGGVREWREFPPGLRDAARRALADSNEPRGESEPDKSELSFLAATARRLADAAATTAAPGDEEDETKNKALFCARFVPDAVSRRIPRGPRRAPLARGARGAERAAQRVGDEVERRELVELVIAVTSAPRRLERRAREVASRVRVGTRRRRRRRLRRRARDAERARRRRVGRVRRRPQRPPQQIPPQVPRLVRRRVRPGGAGAHTGRQGERSSGVPECTTAIVVFDDVFDDVSDDVFASARAAFFFRRGGGPFPFFGRDFDVP